MILQTICNRRETLKRHKIVADEIERRVQLLFRAKERHLKEIQQLEEARQRLQVNVENKAELLDETNNKQEDYCKR